MKTQPSVPSISFFGLTDTQPKTLCFKKLDWGGSWHKQLFQFSPAEYTSLQLSDFRQQTCRCVSQFSGAQLSSSPAPCGAGWDHRGHARVLDWWLLWRVCSSCTHVALVGPLRRLGPARSLTCLLPEGLSQVCPTGSSDLAWKPRMNPWRDRWEASTLPMPGHGPFHILGWSGSHRAHWDIRN